MKIINQDKWIVFIPADNAEYQHLSKWCKYHFGKSHGYDDSPWYIASTKRWTREKGIKIETPNFQRSIIIRNHISNSHRLIELKLIWG